MMLFATYVTCVILNPHNSLIFFGVCYDFGFKFIDKLLLHSDVSFQFCFIIHRHTYTLSDVCEGVYVHASTLHMCETFGHVCPISYISVLSVSQLRS
jgi:hypothetical protein